MKVFAKITRYYWVIDIIAVIFLVGLLIWNIAKVENERVSMPVEQEHWGTFVFSDYLTLKAGDRFFQGESFYDYTLQNMTVGYKEFSRGWQHYQVPLTNPNASIYYTHSGPMDGVINGVLRHFGIEDLSRFLEFNILLHTIALGCWYIAASWLFGRAVSIISLLFIGTTLSSVHLATTICAHGQEWFFAFGAIFIFLLAERSTSKITSRILYSGAWIFTFLQAANTTEFIPFLQIFFIGYLWISRGSLLKSWRLILFMLSAPVMSLLIHWVIIAAAFDGVGNLLRDITAGVSRRTTEFGIAEETPFQYFNLGQTVPFLNGELKYRLGFDFIDMAIMFLLGFGTWFILRKRISSDLNQQLTAQIKLLIVFFVGAFAFQVVFVQATVTQTAHMFKTIVPFAGLLIGMVAVLVIRYLLYNRNTLFVTIPVIVIFIMVLIPITQDRMDNYEIEYDTYSDAYYGRSQAEIRVLTDFVRTNTLFGDIVITDIDTGQTGMPRYPFPAYEYLSGRRFEITGKDVPGVILAVTEFEEIRTSLPEINPASTISYYLLLETASNNNDLGEFARSVNDGLYVFNNEAFIERYPDGNIYSNSNLEFYLYKINPERVLDGNRHAYTE